MQVLQEHSLLTHRDVRNAGVAGAFTCRLPWQQSEMSLLKQPAAGSQGQQVASSVSS
jgi:hypothetical protein